MTGASTDVSVVIVSYRSRELLARCLASIDSCRGDLGIQTIVVDNDSGDGTVEYVRERHPDVRVLAAGGNLGFARATNLGLELATGRIWMWLNPDCEVTPGSLQRLVAALDADPAVGVVGPRLVYPGGGVQPSAQVFPGLIRVLAHLAGLRRLAPWIRGTPLAGWLGREVRDYMAASRPVARDVDWISGACLATMASFARSIGPLDEGYFMYCEDTDWCHRVHDSGRRVRYLPEAVVVHHVGGSGSANPVVTRYHYRSLLRYFRRHRAGQFGWIRLCFSLAFTTRAVAGSLATLIGRRPARIWWGLARDCWAGTE